jgi:hypothetical protein
VVDCSSVVARDLDSDYNDVEEEEEVVVVVVVEEGAFLRVEMSLEAAV